MDGRELEERTKIFSTNVIQLITTLPKSKAADVISYQILKSATSIGASYREATRAKAKADFIHKIAIISHLSFLFGITFITPAADGTEEKSESYSDTRLNFPKKNAILYSSMMITNRQLS